MFLCVWAEVLYLENTGDACIAYIALHVVHIVRSMHSKSIDLDDFHLAPCVKYV